MPAPFRRLTLSLRRRLERSGQSACLPLPEDFSLAVPFAFADPAVPLPKIGVVLHLFHVEQAADFAATLARALPGAELMISTDSAAKRAAILAAFAAWRSDAIDVVVVENRGRDIAPKLVTFAPRYPDYDLLLCLHSKVTEHSQDGAGWRELLVAGLCGSREVVASIMAMFSAEPQTGLVFAQHHEPIRGFVGWEFNFPMAQALARRMGLRLRRKGRMDFPAGSMFWARPAALQPIIDLGWRFDQFPREGEMGETTIAHAVERLFALATEQAGLRWYKVAAPAHYAERGAMVHPASPEDLAAFLHGHGRWLLGEMAEPIKH